MPILDKVIREDLRIISAHMTGLRKNGGKDLLVGNQIVPKNSELDSKMYSNLSNCC